MRTLNGRSSTANGKGKNGRARVNGKSNGRRAVTEDLLESLIEVHRLQRGIFARVASRLEVDPSYVSRVASGQRNSPKIRQALTKEFARAGMRL
jgi:hypothetical protein